MGNHNDFIYPYYKKMSVTALAKIMQANHKLIAPLSFDGYPIINMNAPRSMRSRSQRLQFTQMPFVVKYFQILIDTFRDLVDCHEENDEEDYVPDESGEESDSDYDDDNESELTENDELATIQRQQQQQSNNNNNEQKLLQSKKPAKASQKPNAARNTELNLCPEMVNDKIFNMDFKKWSKEFTHNVSTQNGSAFQKVISMLNESDKNILKKILN